MKEPINGFVTVNLNEKVMAHMNERVKSDLNVLTVVHYMDDHLIATCHLSLIKFIYFV